MSVDPYQGPFRSAPGLRAGRGAGMRRSRLLLAVAGVVGALLAAWVLSHGETVLDEPRVANPSPPAQLPKMEWLGMSTLNFWVPIFYGVTIGFTLLMVHLFVRHRRRTGTRHPALPLFMVFWIGIAADPILNWAMYCNYHPSLLHWPTDWQLFNVAPNVEPLWIVMGAYQVFFIGPAMLGFAMYRRWVVPRVKPHSWADRHQALSVFLAVTLFGFLMDYLMEMWMLNMHIYKYTQIAGPTLVLGGGSLQVFEVLVVGLMIGLYAALLVRDDTGASTCARLASGNRRLARLGLGEYGVAALMVVGSLAAYGVFWTTLRETGSATNIAAGDYPFRASKTYDPNGLLERAGQPGPYFGGTWCSFRQCDKTP
jgi:hypothetical protein